MGPVGGKAAFPDRWLEVTAWSPSAEDGALLVEGLLALGGRAVEERDGRLVTHLVAPAESEAWLGELKALLEDLTGLDDVQVEAAWRANEDWFEVWKRGLTPRRIGRRLVVTPSWCVPEGGADERVLVIDPGMAFGTAEHGTTRGCLRLLEDLVAPGDRVLDVGCGSGILAIAAALLDAGEVVAVEGDPLAVEQARENVTRNRVEDRVRVVQEWADAETFTRLDPADGIVSNIESSVLERLLPGFRVALRPRGWLVLGGVLAGEWESLAREAGRHGLVVRDTVDDGEWRTGAFTDAA